MENVHRRFGNWFARPIFRTAQHLSKYDPSGSVTISGFVLF